MRKILQMPTQLLIGRTKGYSVREGILDFKEGREALQKLKDHNNVAKLLSRNQSLDANRNRQVLWQVKVIHISTKTAIIDTHKFAHDVFKATHGR